LFKSGAEAPLPKGEYLLMGFITLLTAIWYQIYDRHHAGRFITLFSARETIISCSILMWPYSVIL